MYNFNHLYYFYMTVKSGGVTLAANHLSISQPSLSSQLGVLESFLQTKLFKKVGRKNELTPEGSIIYGFCRQMFEISEEMHESIQESIPYASRKISIGVSYEMAHSFVVEIVSKFLSKFNENLRPKVNMISGSYEKLTEKLRFREVDAVVCPQAMTHPELESLKRIQIPVNLVSSSKLKIPRSYSHRKIEDILRHLGKKDHINWVQPSMDQKLRSEINSYLEDNFLKGRTAFESDVVESLVRSVVDNMGVALLPKIYVAKELKEKTLRCFGPQKGYWSHSIWLSSHSNNSDDYLIQALIEAFEEACLPHTGKKRRPL